MRRIIYSFSKIRTFESLEILNEYLEIKKPVINLVYFRSSWNPACTITDEHIKKLAEKEEFEIVKIDSELAPLIAEHYGVRAEPEFVFCLHGDEIVRQIGVNQEGLEDKVEKVKKVAKKMESLNPEWIKYGSKFENFYKESLKQIYKKE